MTFEYLFSRYEIKKMNDHRTKFAKLYMIIYTSATEHVTGAQRLFHITFPKLHSHLLPAKFCYLINCRIFFRLLGILVYMRNYSNLNPN